MAPKRQKHKGNHPLKEISKEISKDFKRFQKISNPKAFNLSSADSFWASLWVLNAM
jgi:hypothetical protein